MPDYGSILTTVLENVARLLPRRTILEYEQGVHWRRGEVFRHLKPGRPAWFIPLFDSIDIESCVNRVVDTEILDLETSDGENITIKATINYYIDDIVKYYTNLYEHSTSIMNLVEREVAGVIFYKSYETLKSEIIRQPNYKYSNIEKTIMDNVKKISGQYGIGIESIGITKFAHTMTVRIIGGDTFYGGSQE